MRKSRKSTHRTVQGHGSTIGWVNFSEFIITMSGDCKMSTKKLK